MVDSTRSLFVSVMGKDEVSSPLFTHSSLKPSEFEGEISSFHRNFCTVQFCYLQSILLNQKTIISLTITCCSISVFHANVWKREPQSYFWTKLRPKGPEKNFWMTGPPFTQRLDPALLLARQNTA